MFCGKCGSKIESNEKFCSSCGNLLSNEVDNNKLNINKLDINTY